jgi:hypothetical protein
MFSTLVLCSIIALAFCCISLLYFYYSKLKHISYLESQLMSLKMMFANYQNNVERKLVSMESGIHPNVMTILDSTPEVSSNNTISLSPTEKVNTNNNPILSELLPDDDLVSSGPIPFFKIVNMTSNPIFDRTNKVNTDDAPQITEIIDNESDNNLDPDIENIDLEEVSTSYHQNHSTPSKDEHNDLELELDLDNVSAEDIKTISLDNKKSEQSLNITSSDLQELESNNLKTINLQPDVDFKLSGNIENTLDGIMDELEELSEIASVCDDVRTINIKTMTTADLANLSVKELKELCTKYNIKNKKGTKNELIERLNQINKE